MAEFAAAPDMTRRHYEWLAATLAGVQPGTGADIAEQAQWLDTCDAFADALESSNPRFDRARFLKACGVDQ